jgi:hypothetical protein
MMADMLSATKELVSVLKAATSNKQEELRMRTHEKWMKMASIYVTCGQHDLALATMKKIELIRTIWHQHARQRVTTILQRRWKKNVLLAVQVINMVRKTIGTMRATKGAMPWKPARQQ